MKEFVACYNINDKLKTIMKKHYKYLVYAKYSNWPVFGNKTLVGYSNTDSIVSINRELKHYIDITIKDNPDYDAQFNVEDALAEFRNLIINSDFLYID